MRSVSIAGLVLMVVAVAGLFSTHTLLSRSPIVIAVQALAFALLLWARVTFGRRSFHAAANPTAGGMVTSGPYRFIRHPIYTAACAFCWAGIVTNSSAPSIGCGVLLIVGALMRMLAEERLLVGRYPEYRQYTSATKRMVPYLF
jgi:protein-S-isoprenylcysteine O-methyltransferase Ste14